MFIFSKKEKRVYLDNAGATPMSSTASLAFQKTLSMYGNPSGIHKEGQEAGVLLDEGRSLCAKALNAHAYEIYFTGSGTESCNMAVLGTYYGFIKNKNNTSKIEDAFVPHIITSSIEHPAVLEPIKYLEKEGKVKVTYLPVYDNGIVKVKDIREALRDETFLVSVMYANNEIGTLEPVKEIGRCIDEWKKENGRTYNEYPYFHTDACQAANYCNLDTLRLKCHLMTVNSSKCYGPKGIALLYKREGIRLEHIIFGGGQERGFRSGTENTPAAYAFGKALEEAQFLKEKESKRLRELRDATVQALKEAIPGIVFYGAFDEYLSLKDEVVKDVATHTGIKEMHRLPNNINCRIPGISSEEMILRLDAKGVALSHKSACASQETDGSYVVMALGATEKEAQENIRISMGRHTTQKDMEYFVRAVKEIQAKFAH